MSTFNFWAFVFTDQYLKTAAQEIIAFLKKKIGINDFTATYASVQQARNQRKEKRKADRAISVCVLFFFSLFSSLLLSSVNFLLKFKLHV